MLGQTSGVGPRRLNKEKKFVSIYVRKQFLRYSPPRQLILDFSIFIYGKSKIFKCIQLQLKRKSLHQPHI